MGGLFSCAKGKKPAEPQTPEKKADAPVTAEAASPTVGSTSTASEPLDDLLSEDLPPPRRLRQASINAADLTLKERRDLFKRR